MVTLEDLPQAIWTRFNELAISPLMELYSGLDHDGRVALCILLACAASAGFIVGRRRPRRILRRRARSFQNHGEALVSRALVSSFDPPDYHLMNHVTIQMADGTTQVDHILVSRFGVFVIETKHYSGWIFGRPAQSKWTQVKYKRRYKFQNPIFQNRRHVCAVQDLLDFLEPQDIQSLVVFTGEAEFKTEMPDGVLHLEELVPYIRDQIDEVMSSNRLQFCVGRLETGRLAISAKTDVDHVRSLSERYGVAW